MASTLQGLSNPEVRAHAQKQADAVLQEYWPEDDVPVDPAMIARRMGLEVFSAQLGNDVYGLITGTPGGAQIYVDIDQPPVRVRFTIAHELGHYVEHSEREDEDDLDYVDRRSDRDPYNKHEVHANHFAGALLMPSATLRRWQSQKIDLYRMAVRFGVSLSALHNRIERMVP